MSEDKSIKNNEITNKDDLVNALKGDFATSVNRIYINSLDKEVDFSEISVQDQKTLTRIMAANQHRKDVVYDAQCAILNKSSLDKTFDVYQVSEFDRLKLLIALYQNNMFTNDVKFICEECGTENAYKLDFANVLAKLDEFDLSPVDFDYENTKFKYHFSIEFPSVRLVSAFHKSYFAKHKGTPRKIQQADESLQNIEYLNLFIKSVEFTNKTNGATRKIQFSDYKVGDIEDIISAFPQDVLYTDGGLMKFIVEKFIKPMNESFDKHECYSCGAIHEKEGSNNTESFL